MKAVSGVFLGILVIGIFGFLAWIGFSYYQQQQGPALEATTKPLFATRTPKAFAHSSTLVPSSAVKTGTASPSTTVIDPTNVPSAPILPTSQKNDCGETGSWNILILGSDYSEMAGKKGSDLTRVLRVDFDNMKVVMFAFSRDLWVEADGIGLENPHINATRLGAIYYEGRLRSLQFAELDTMVDGTRMTARALSKNFSLNTDHYITIDLTDLGVMIDTIGGLPINIPNRIAAPGIPIIINTGQQTMTGAQVMAYVRAMPDSDFDRIYRNDLLLEALRQKLLDPIVFLTIPELFNKFKKVIASDLSLEQIDHLACLMKTVPNNSIIKESVKPEWTSAGPYTSLLWKKSDVITRLRELGLIP